MRQQAFRYLIVLLSCLLWEVGLLADEQYALRRLEVEDGLSQNMVYCICQDSHGFIWIGTQGGLNRYDGNSFKVFRNGGEGRLGNDGILKMTEAPDGRLWVGTLLGLYAYDPAYEDFSSAGLNGKVRDMAFDHSGVAYAIINDRSLIRISPDLKTQLIKTFPDRDGTSLRSLCIDNDGNIWTAGYATGLTRITPDGLVTSFNNSAEGNDLFTKVIPNGTESLLVGTMDKGVLLFNLRTHNFSPVSSMDGRTVNFVHDILRDSNGRIWVGAENGVFICDKDKVTHLKHIPNDPYSLSDNAVFSLSEDSEGGIWIGTYFGGVNYYSQYLTQFSKYFPISGYNNLKGKNISEFLETGDGYIWIGTEDAGLHRFNPSNGSFDNGFIPASNVHALAELDGMLWVGTYGNGLFLLDHSGRSRKNILFSRRGYSQMEDNIYAIFRDMDGRTMLGTDGGLFEFVPSGSSLVSIAPELIKGTVKDIRQDFHGDTWVATAGNGIFRKSVDSGQWKHEYGESQYFTCILEDSAHDLWFGSENNGVLHYDHMTGKFDIVLTPEKGLPDEMVYMLLEDEAGNIWGSTNHGIFMVAREDGRVLVFDHNSGLTCDQYNFRSGIRTRDGSLYFGGVKGFVSFNPSQFRWPEEQSRIVFNRFLLQNREIDLRDKHSPLKRSVIFGDRIVLKPDQSSFSIGFADLSFPLSGVRAYQYRLKGLDSNWYDVSKSRLVTFYELRHGRYELEVRANSYADLSDVEPCSISIQILPPWYLTWWAFVLYALLLIATTGISLRYLSEAAKKRNADILEKMERSKEKELYDAKIRFFTQITHEIRTPLTLITAPMDEIMEKTGKDNPAYQDLSIVQKNSQRLLTLVNELLDFRKVEAGNLLPNFVSTDIVGLVKETLSRFKPNMDTQKIEVTASYPDRLEADVDMEILTKILSNILANACKHAESSIVLKLSNTEDKFILSIMNDGDRIPESEAEHIFDPFVKLYENVPGSGLGLPFARTLAATHGGNLYLDTKSEMTCFVVEMPLRQDNTVITGEMEESTHEDKEAENAEDGRYRILVVDDNEDFRDFLSRKIGEHYTVLTAEDGRKAAEILSREMIDLVVTDLMMPGLDGASLCSSIKSDISSSHIPVILVTAKSDMNTRMECIRNGADDFIPKPFQISYLLVRIENMLRSRDNLRKAFSSTPDIAIESIATSSKDEEFISRLKEMIESKMEDPNLDVDILAQAMNMSRATFYRKMKGFTDVSPNEFIRLCRLRKAAEMLASGNNHINEIAYSVGFSSPSYFSRCFSKQFGISPKEYAARY